MRKLYYVSFLKNWGVGIQSKIDMHLDIFKENGYDVQYLVLEKSIMKFYRYLYRVIPFFSENDYKLLDAIEKDSYVYIRYGKMDFQGYLAIRKMKKRVKKIIVELPTYPYDNEKSKVYKLLDYKDKYWRYKLYKYIDKIVTYSNDEFIFGVDTIQSSNFVDFNKVKIVSGKERERNRIDIIAVATLSFWHGYDRMIKGMYTYYQNYPETKVYFHLVGDGDLYEFYKRMVEDLGISRFVKVYGKKYGKELDDLYDKADIALDSLGRHRSKVYYNSTLKGKEYLAKGLPIVSGVATELDFDPCFPYYLRVPADDTDINVNDIVNFYNKVIYMKKDYKLNEWIRNYAEENFSMYKCFQPILDVYDKCL